MKEIVIGISMRMTNAAGYDELRDTIACDWGLYLQNNFPEAKWLYLPNLEKDIIPYMQKWRVNRIILTGGDDYGVFSKRDETEYNVFQYARQNKLPVLGICRGMQLVNKWLGGEISQLSKSESKEHVATSHKVIFRDHEKMVNSYHNNVIYKPDLAKALNILCEAPNGQGIEGVTGDNILGLMWHPERNLTAPDWETKLISNFLLNEHE
ncbi:gamma-glutamyl-gamma-aminobutyrate hydrolase family protein [uncultured Marivirga sp.]|uniref:gamma-glutamyl-gamma-aminobutyrate hydrolase family protein n=1 Tax=uncultured Marivirga sp. TaxID=1123707 RepID=UPI0030EEC377|tara:strand:+ start:115776 stop:116402 length:627 start_codon:yes stop_codon:yes gene_type:complete